MGRPFKTELENINATIESCNKLNVSNLSSFITKIDSPIYIVGSGGSLSACYLAEELFQSMGKYAKAVTPLELIYAQPTLNRSTVIFISASGRNKDIKLALKKAIEAEPISIAIICMKENSPLSIIAAKFNIVKVFEYLLVSGKDGFLATNSLVAFFVILYRSFTNSIVKAPSIKEGFYEELSRFHAGNNEDCCYSILYSGWGKSIAMDLESKCSEAGLTPTLISDFRNFGHGRHHWFDKRKNSAIVAITHKQDSALCEKTLNILPEEIPKLMIESTIEGAGSVFELLIKSFYLISTLGVKMGIDPGRPGVPEYGSELYHLSYVKSLSKNESYGLSARANLSITRKAKVSSLKILNKDELSKWTESYNNFIKKLKKTVFGAILFDYDGTLCSSSERLTGLSEETSELLINILEKDYVIGIVTGRGKSAKDTMRNAIPKKLWRNVIMGYYNGADQGFLTDDSLPNINQTIDSNLVIVDNTLRSLVIDHKLKYTLRPNQITIEIQESNKWNFVRDSIVQELKTTNMQDVQILESSHSMDIIPNNVSKMTVMELCESRIKELKLPSGILRIGDKGQWAGNDFMLLDSPFGLSVDEVSPKYDSCWNIVSLGNRNVAGTHEYLSHLVIEENGMKFKINK